MCGWTTVSPAGYSGPPGRRRGYPAGHGARRSQRGSTLVDADRVAFAQERLPSTDETDRLADWFRVLGDPTRTACSTPSWKAASCASPTSPTRSARRRRRCRTPCAGCARATSCARRRAGRLIYYSLDDAHVRMLLDLGREHLRHT